MSTDALGSHELAEVLRFRAALTLDPRGSFHVVVADTRRVLDQARGVLGMEMELLRPPAPHAVDPHEHAERILQQLDDALERAAERPVLLDAIVSTPSTDLAWRLVFQRLNELRNFTESRSSGPLVFCVSAWLETALGHEAPDVWSKRGSGMRLVDRTPNHVFVSYSYESVEHAAAVERMAAQWVEAGLSVFLDRWQEPAETGGERTVEQEVRRADVIACVCTPIYRARLDGQAPPGLEDVGATREATSVRAEAHALGFASDRFRVLHVGGTELAIPSVLGASRARVFRWPADGESLLASLAATTVRDRLLRGLVRAFGDDLAALERWASGFLTMLREAPPSFEVRAREVVEGLLRLGDPSQRAEALGSLAMMLGEQRESIDSVAAALGLGELPRSPPQPSPVPPSPASTLDAEIARYLAEATARHREIPLAGFHTKVRIRLTLEDLYVPLDAIVHRGRRAREVFVSAEVAEHSRARAPGEHERLALADAFARARALGRRGLILLGDPGSGKTTHLEQVLLKLAQDGSESLGLPRGLVPVFLPLRKLPPGSLDPWELLELELGELLPAAPPGFGKGLRERGNLLLLLDGLDEVADARARVEVSRWIERARRSMPDSYFLVSSRYGGYTRDVELEAAFLELHLRPLDDAQVRRFVTNWYTLVEHAVNDDSQVAAQEATRRTVDLLAALSRPEFTASARIYEMTRNPLLLTAICLVHREYGALPSARARLYDECIGVLLERWRPRFSQALDSHASRALLQSIALWMHGEQGRTQASTDQLCGPLEDALGKLPHITLEPEPFLRAIRDDSGVLTGWGLDNFGFMHLGFQEYLAARELRDRGLEGPSVFDMLAQRFEQSWWQEVTLLMLALRDPSVFEPFMRSVVRRPEFVEWWDSEMMQRCLAEAAEPSAQPFVELLQQGEAAQTSGSQQQAAAELLARQMPEALEGLEELLRDHPAEQVRRWWARRTERRAASRTTVAPRGGLELVLVPGGRFMMGSPEDEQGRDVYVRYLRPEDEDERVDPEGPRHEVTLASFYLAQTPVTNAQFQEFLKANPDAPKPEYWGDRQYNQPNQPAVGVSWHEARAYCAWAGLTLPTEAQWEYACRAGTTTRYWSGEHEGDLARVGWYRANSGGRLHPVAEKEPNGFELYDMHGNVFEWCLDAWVSSYDGAVHRTGDGLIEAPADDSIRVYRGASFYGDADVARSAFRYGMPSDARLSTIGFRPALLANE